MIEKESKSSNGVEFRHTIEKKSEIYAYFLSSNARQAYGRFGIYFKNMNHFEVYLMDKCRDAFLLIGENLIKEPEDKNNKLAYDPIKTIKDCEGFNLHEIKNVTDRINTRIVKGLNKPSLL
jgi:hypothetical protein